MKNKINFLALAVVFTFTLLAMGPAGAESINTLQQNLNSSQITTEGGAAAEVGNASNTEAAAARATGAAAQQNLAESCNRLKNSCNQLKNSCNRFIITCKGFFREIKPIFRSFFQSLFSIFKQFIQQFVDAFKGCSGSISIQVNNCNRQSGNGNNVVNNGSNGQAAGDNSSSANSGCGSAATQSSDNSNSTCNNGANGSKTPPANNDQGTAIERSTGEDSAVDINDAMSLVRALKDKFNITVETGTAQWSLSQLQQTYQTLCKLPPSFVAQTNMIQRISTTNLGANVGGYVSSGAPRVYITDHGTRSMTFVLVHEMAHCFHFAKPAIFNQWQSQFWGGRNGYSGTGTQISPSVSSYGNTNAMEDFAESVRAYYMSGPAMKRSHPDRYEFIKNNVMGGVEY